MKKKLVFSRMLTTLCVYVFLHLLAGPGTQLQAATLNNYCKTYLSGGGFDLSAVSITGSSLNFTGSGSYGTTSDGSYYYELSPTTGNTCTLEPGKTYTLSVTTTSGDIVSVWFDFNQNGTFEATEWTQVSTSTTAGTPSSCSFTVPATAITGQTGMRIRSRGYGNTNGANDACSSFGSGCTLDFTLTIGSLQPAVPTADFSSMSTFSTPGSFVQFYDQSLGVPANWKWTFTGGSPSTSNVQNPVVSYAANGTYNVKLVVSNALGADSIVKSGYITISNAITMPVTGSRNISTCNALIYDNGGTANYSSYSDGTTTIYPGSTGSAVKLDFISFNVNTYDYLYVFNGTSTSATLLGTFTGTTLPNSITATNPSGALTLRFYSNSYNSATAGFVAQASCADLVLQNLNAVNWTSNIDNNKNGYSQSRIINCSLKNESTSSAVVYTKLYAKLSTDATYTLLNTSPSITIPGATSYTQSYQVNGLNTKGTYSFKIEMYNGANTLLNSFDSLKVAALGGLKFESSSDDAIADYVVTGLAGNGFDLSSVSITGTTLNNTAARPTTSTNGSYYVEWQPTTGKTCTLTTSSLYSLNITSQNSNMSISAWIDYNQDKVFQASEWIQVASQSVYGTASTVTFRVPANALAGNTRMRIRTNSYYYSNTSSDATSSFSYGSTEDYTINIQRETPTKPVVNFLASDVNVSVGTTVQFADLTTGVPTAWSWRFNGATPATSTLQNPSVVYSTVGTYPVTLIATNSLGTDSITKTAYINVSNTVNMPASGSKSITACGLTIYDNGGTSNYSNSTNGILTIYPASANSAVSLKFSQFATESYCDYLYIYNGTSTSATLIGSYNGTNLPADVIATNASGAITLRFYSDGSSTYAGFVAQANCVPLKSQYINSASWSNVIDNNYNTYAQSQTLSYTIKNDNTNLASLYTKLYCNRTGNTVDSLLYTSTAISVPASTTSATQTRVVTGLNQMDSYNFKLKLYNSADSLLSTYDLSSFAVLGSQKFESATADGDPTYCKGSLGGNSFNISAVSIANTTFSNTATRPAIRTLDGSYYTEFQPTTGKTCVLTPGRAYSLSVTPNAYGTYISAWFDFNQDKTFQLSEYLPVASYGYSGTAYTVSFTVPTTALAGDFTMRIRTSSNSFTGSDACSYLTSGCVEDYTLSIAGPGTTAPDADFSASATTANYGEPLTFYDQSANTPTSWKWTFDGGTPATSTLQNPIVTYTTAGTFNVKLVARNAFGSDSIVKSNFITITNTAIVPATGSNSVTACGVTIKDNGGTANYANSSNGTLTIYPAESGKQVRLVFSEFSTESCDYLYVYDGTSTNATQIGYYYGSSMPSTITANNASGALTLRFTSDGSVTYSGFTAVASCVLPQGLEVKTAIWTNQIDNNYNGFTQSRMLNYTIKNNTSTKSVVYAKIYVKTVDAVIYMFTMEQVPMPRKLVIIMVHLCHQL